MAAPPSWPGRPVSIAKAILFGFKRITEAYSGGVFTVSIAKAILFGFKLEAAVGQLWQWSVSIAKAILFGFKRNVAGDNCPARRFQSLRRFSLGSSWGGSGEAAGAGGGFNR